MNVLQAVGPPEAGPFVGVERQSLFRQPLARVGLHGQIVIEHVVGFGAVFQKEAVPDALVADAIADDQIIRAVNRQPAIGAIPNRRPDDRAAAHRVADEMKMKRIAAQHIFLAEMPKLRVADRAGGIAMIHRMAALARRIGRFDDDIAAQIGHFAAKFAASRMGILQRPIDRQAACRR